MKWLSHKILLLHHTSPDSCIWMPDYNKLPHIPDHTQSLFYKTQFVYEKTVEWSKCEKEFVKRAGFTLIASLSIHDKKSNDKIFEEFLQIIKRESTDERNYVKKAVNWALRQIGKRNMNLNIKAIKIARGIQKIDSKSARWIATNAIKELTDEKIKYKLNKKD